MRDEDIAAVAAKHLQGKNIDLGVVWDIGAHIGGFARAALQRGAEHVVAVEANAEHCEKLRATGNVRVTVIHGALWDSDETLMLMNIGNSGQGHVVGNKGMPVGKVQGITCAQVYEQTGRWPDTIKMDVEGAEWRIMRDESCHTALAHARNIHLELHEANPRFFGKAMVIEEDRKYLREVLQKAKFEGASTVIRSSRMWLQGKSVCPV